MMIYALGAYLIGFIVCFVVYLFLVVMKNDQLMLSDIITSLCLSFLSWFSLIGLFLLNGDTKVPDVTLWKRTRW